MSLHLRALCAILQMKLHSTFAEVSSYEMNEHTWVNKASLIVETCNSILPKSSNFAPDEREPISLLFYYHKTRQIKLCQLLL